MKRFCAKLTTPCLVVLAAAAGLAQNFAVAQATLDAARPQFGSGAVSSAVASAPVQPAQPTTQSAQTYQSAQPTQSGWPAAQPTWQSQPSAGSPLISPGAADPDKKFGIGDMVSFSIIEDKDPPVMKRVADTGELDIPYIGRVSVVGKSAAQVAAEVKRKLEAQYYYKATVNIGLEQTAIGRSLGKVYVTGDVRSPGPQDIYPNEKATVSAAVVKAGQFTQFADTGHVRLNRKTKDGRTEKIVVDVGAVLKRGDMGRDVEVQDGDYIFVPRKLINW